jgi:hypothetical protein
MINIEKLKRGDIIKHKDGDSYVVVENYNQYAVGIRTITISNPYEWDMVDKGE